MARVKSTAERLDAGFKELAKLRQKFGFPQVDSEQEVGEGWHMTYGMPHQTVERVRTVVRDIRSAFGRIPWEHDPNKE